MSKFNWDDYEDHDAPSKESPGFSWDHYEDDSSGSEPTALDSASRGFAQGGTFGFADEIGAAGITAADYLTDLLGGESPTAQDKKLRSQGFTGDLGSGEYGADYDKIRNENRSADKLAEKTNPGSFGAGQFGGGLAASLALPGSGSGLGQVVGRGATEGAAYGLGASEADDASGLAKDAAIGAGLGGAGGALAYGVGKAAPWVGRQINKAGEALGGFAEKAAVNATGATGRESAKFSEDAGRELLDRGIVGFGDSQANIASKAGRAVDAANAQIDESLKALESQGVKVDANEIYNTVSKKIDELAADPSQADVASHLRKELDNLIGSVEAKGGNTDFGITEAEKIKRGYNRKAGNWMDPEKGQVGKELYGTWRQSVEDAAERVSPDVAAQFKEGKKAYGLLRPIEEAAERRSLTTAQSPVGGFLDTAASAAGAVAGGGPGALALPVARRLISPRISSSVAVGADKLSKVLSSNPQAFGKYAQALTQAASRGVNALAANHYVLQQSDPQYQEQMKNIFGDPDE